VDVRSLGYRTDLMIRKLEGSHIADRGDHLVIRTAGNPGYWWGNFLLLASPPPAGEAASWLAAFAAEFPDAKHVALGIDVTEAGIVDDAELVAAGFEVERSSVLTARTVQEPPRPNKAATYRELSGDEDWQQAAELRSVVTEGTPGHDPGFLRSRVTAERALTEAGYGSWFGAFMDGNLVAQLGLITDGSGVARYQNVESHPAVRRRGLAATLVWHAGERGLEAGADTLVMVADPDDVAIRVYRSAGFADAETQIGFERRP
jgi:ribosomal protein S18 acetylase RimI-like enzyme